MSMRSLDQGDFDLETFIKMMDEAITSKDERVQNALRSLLMIVTLTRNADTELTPFETNQGPLRRMQEDLRDLSRRLRQLENEVGNTASQNSPWNYSYPGGSSGTVTIPVGGWSVFDTDDLTLPNNDITITLTDTK